MAHRQIGQIFVDLGFLGEPELEKLLGQTIITSDGTTLLGADDKAGVAVIMTAIEHLNNNPDIKHGPIRVVGHLVEDPPGLPPLADLSHGHVAHQVPRNPCSSGVFLKMNIVHQCRPL